ncbi:MAG: DUF5110 domain-containing protein [Saprospiraceae bacterium]|nr:DUF5110 domain-containing protein [Saprospiraceae bacterium]
MPEGKWYELNFNQSKGERAIEKSVVIPALLGRPILFVKSGSFIPIVDKSGTSTEDYTNDTLTVHYYFDSKKSSNTLFNDDGWSKSSLKNDNFELLTFSANHQAEQLSITLQLKKGKKFPKRTQPRHIIFVIHGNDDLMYSQPGSSKSIKRQSPVK